MSNKIKIKPWDQSLAGSKIRLSNWDKDEWFLVRYVGYAFMFGTHKENGDETYVFNVDGSGEFWSLYEDPLPPNIILKDGKKYKVMSPAIKIHSEIVYVPDGLFESKEDAETYYIRDRGQIQWPALDRNGDPIQYLVEVKE